jgi:hypothetical protein
MKALAMGFRYVEAGPLVRSSYHAGRHANAAGGREYVSDPIFTTQSYPIVAPDLVQLKRAAED